MTTEKKNSIIIIEIYFSSKIYLNLNFFLIQYTKSISSKYKDILENEHFTIRHWKKKYFPIFNTNVIFLGLL